MKLLFDTEGIKEFCSGCKGYHDHHSGKTADNQGVWKCLNCGRITVWLGGDSERVVSPGNPPVEA